jgi:PilZ domain-containing protein
VSRIWDALKQAENERGRAKQPRKAAGHPHSDGADRRRSQRWGQPVPVLVYGSDSEKQPFHEETETADINDDGCSFTIATTVAKGQRLFLVNMLNDAERECRVVQAGKRVRGKADVAVEFSISAPDFWLPRKV